VAACTGPDRTECVNGPILFGACGAGGGLVLGRLFARTVIVYRSQAGDRDSRESGSPEGPFAEVALSVNLGDRLRVGDQTEAAITGRLIDLTGDEIAIETDPGVKHFTSATVKEVRVRSYSLRRGALVGAGISTALAVASPACRSNPHCSPIAAAAVGAVPSLLSARSFLG
jgi:hypothetical protein